MVMSLITGSSIDRAYSASLFNTGNFIETVGFDEVCFWDDFFFDVCFFITQTSFAIVGLLNFSRQFKYYVCWNVPVVAVHPHTYENFRFLIHFPEHDKDPETLFVLIVGGAAERLHSRV